MNYLSRRAMLAIVAVMDVALNARPRPVSAKSLAARHRLPPRHLETMLQTLVRAGILKGMRGPRGGYELARERRMITAGEVARAAMAASGEEADPQTPDLLLASQIVAPILQEAADAFLASLDAVTIDEICRAAEGEAGRRGPPQVDFAV